MSVADGKSTASAPGRLIERFDTRTRLIATLLLLAAIISLKTIAILFAALVVALALLGLFAPSLRGLGHRLLHVEGFMLMLLALLPLTLPGETLFQIGRLTASREGLMQSLRILLKVNASIFIIFALLGALEPVRLGQAMARLGLPPRLVHLLLFTVRYVPVLRAEISRLFEAMRVRAFVLRSNWHCWRTLGNLIGLMLVRAMDRAERVSEAMRCRGFSGRFALGQGEQCGAADLVFGCAIALTALALVFAEHVV